MAEADPASAIRHDVAHQVRLFAEIGNQDVHAAVVVEIREGRRTTGVDLLGRRAALGKDLIEAPFAGSNHETIGLGIGIAPAARAEIVLPEPAHLLGAEAIGAAAEPPVGGGAEP